MPDADPIVLRINGVDWQFWKNVQVSRQIDAIAGQFNISLADPWVEDAQALPIAAGMACEVLIGDEPFITGYIDKATPSFSAHEHGISISGRDKTGDMVDCSAIHTPGQWSNQTCLQLAEILATPFGISTVAEGDVGAPIPVFKLEQGEKAFEALDRALKQRELLAMPNGQGGLVLAKVGSRQAEIALEQGLNILSAQAAFDAIDRFSHYIVQGQQQGSDEIFGAAAAEVSAKATDPGIDRFRPFIVRAENQVNAASARQRAAWEASVRAARSVTVTVTVQGFRQRVPGVEQETQNSAPLWQENALIDCKIPYLRIEQQLLISKVTFARDYQGGSLTQLELKDPNAFQPEPKTEPTPGQTGKLGPGGPIEKDKGGIMGEQREQAAREQQQIKDGK